MHQDLLLCSHYSTTCPLAPLGLREEGYTGPTKSWPIDQMPEGDAGCLLMDVVAFEQVYTTNRTQLFQPSYSDLYHVHGMDLCSR